MNIGAKLEKLLDSLEDPDSLNDLELEFQEIQKEQHKVWLKFKKFEKKLDKIIVGREKNVD